MVDIEKCSWEKGVTDAWETIINMLNVLGKDEDISKDERAVMRVVAHALEHTDAVEHTRSRVKVRNLGIEEDDEEEELEVGDVVIDPRGKECVITNTETHIHVICIKDGKTCIWGKKLKDEFKPTGKRIIGVGKVEL